MSLKHKCNNFMDKKVGERCYTILVHNAQLIQNISMYVFIDLI